MRETESVRRSARRYTIEFGGAMAAYAGAVIAAMAWLKAHPDAPGRVVVALVPVLPVLYGFRALYRFWTRMDELNRRMVVDSLAFAFAATAPLVITYGFLESAGLPRLSVWWVWTVMGTAWAVGSLLAKRRYR